MNKEIEYLPNSKISPMEVNTVYHDDEETLQDLVCKYDNDINDIKEDIQNIETSLDNLENDVNELKDGNIDIDLTNYVTKTELSMKVDKVNGKSLISDSEIERISTLKNYDDTDIKNSLNSKANKTELHSHSNKSVLDNISSAKVTEWNNKSTFSGNYNDLTNKPTIPNKTSQLTNDSNFLSSIPSEYVTETKLNNKGYLTQHQDLSNYPMTSELTLGVHTDGLIYLFKGNQPVGNGVAQSTTILPEGDVVGYVDSSNNIVLSGNLSSGTYDLKYEMEDGSLIDVGQIVKKEVAINYTNQVPLSIDTDGTIFNGVGYKDGYRGNSSGGLSALSGCTVTGLIPFNPATDTVRVKGVNRSSSIPSGDFGYVAIYDKSKKFLAFSNPSGHQNANFTWVNNNYGYADEDGSYVIYNPSLTNCYIETYISSLKDSTGYIRLCGQGTGKDMIVTINERIR